MFYPIDDELPQISVDSVHNFLTNERSEHYKTREDGLSHFSCPPIPSCWLFFAQQDDDQLYLGDDGYEWDMLKIDKIIDTQNQSDLITIIGCSAKREFFQRKILLLRMPVRKGDAILIVYQGKCRNSINEDKQFTESENKKRSSQAQTSPQKKSRKGTLKGI